MKKILGIIMIIAFICFSINAEAQIYKILSSGTAADTLVASQTYYKTFKISPENWTQNVAVQIFTDSISGTPAYTAKLYQSLDNTNWELSGGETATTTTGVDTTFILKDTLFEGLYGKVKLVAGAGAQKSTVYIRVKTFNK